MNASSTTNATSNATTGIIITSTPFSSSSPALGVADGGKGSELLPLAMGGVPCYSPALSSAAIDRHHDHHYAQQLPMLQLLPAAVTATFTPTTTRTAAHHSTVSASSLSHPSPSYHHHQQQQLQHCDDDQLLFHQHQHHHQHQSSFYSSSNAGGSSPSAANHSPAATTTAVAAANNASFYSSAYGGDVSGTVRASAGPPLPLCLPMISPSAVAVGVEAETATTATMARRGSVMMMAHRSAAGGGSFHHGETATPSTSPHHHCRGSTISRGSGRAVVVNATICTSLPSDDHQNHNRRDRIALSEGEHCHDDDDVTAEEEEGKGPIHAAAGGGDDEGPSVGATAVVLMAMGGGGADEDHEEGATSPTAAISSLRGGSGGRGSRSLPSLSVLGAKQKRREREREGGVTSSSPFSATVSGGSDRTAMPTAAAAERPYGAKSGSAAALAHGNARRRMAKAFMPLYKRALLLAAFGLVVLFGWNWMRILRSYYYDGSGDGGGGGGRLLSSAGNGHQRGDDGASLQHQQQRRRRYSAAILIADEVTAVGGKEGHGQHHTARESGGAEQMTMGSRRGASSTTASISSPPPLGGRIHHHHHHRSDSFPSNSSSNDSYASASAYFSKRSGSGGGSGHYQYQHYGAPLPDPMALFLRPRIDVGLGRTVANPFPRHQWDDDDNDHDNDNDGSVAHTPLRIRSDASMFRRQFPLGCPTAQGSSPLSSTSSSSPSSSSSAAAATADFLSLHCEHSPLALGLITVPSLQDPIAVAAEMYDEARRVALGMGGPLHQHARARANKKTEGESKVRAERAKEGIRNSGPSSSSSSVVASQLKFPLRNMHLAGVGRLLNKERREKKRMMAIGGDGDDDDYIVNNGNVIGVEGDLMPVSPSSSASPTTEHPLLRRRRPKPLRMDVVYTFVDPTSQSFADDKLVVLRRRNKARRRAAKKKMASVKEALRLHQLMRRQRGGGGGRRGSGGGVMGGGSPTAPSLPPIDSSDFIYHGPMGDSVDDVLQSSGALAQLLSSSSSSSSPSTSKSRLSAERVASSTSFAVDVTAGDAHDDDGFAVDDNYDDTDGSGDDELALDAALSDRRSYDALMAAAGLSLPPFRDGAAVSDGASASEAEEDRATSPNPNPNHRVVRNGNSHRILVPLGELSGGSHSGSSTGEGGDSSEDGTMGTLKTFYFDQSAQRTWDLLRARHPLLLSVDDADIAADLDADDDGGGGADDGSNKRKGNHKGEGSIVTDGGAASIGMGASTGRAMDAAHRKYLLVNGDAELRLMKMLAELRSYADGVEEEAQRSAEGAAAARAVMSALSNATNASNVDGSLSSSSAAMLTNGTAASTNATSSSLLSPAEREARRRHHDRSIYSPTAHHHQRLAALAAAVNTSTYSSNLSSSHLMNSTTFRPASAWEQRQLGGGGGGVGGSDQQENRYRDFNELRSSVRSVFGYMINPTTDDTDDGNEAEGSSDATASTRDHHHGSDGGDSGDGDHHPSLIGHVFIVLSHYDQIPKWLNPDAYWTLEEARAAVAEARRRRKGRSVGGSGSANTDEDDDDDAIMNSIPLCDMRRPTAGNTNTAAATAQPSSSSTFEEEKAAGSDGDEGLAPSSSSVQSVEEGVAVAEECRRRIIIVRHIELFTLNDDEGVMLDAQWRGRGGDLDAINHTTAPMLATADGPSPSPSSSSSSPSYSPRTNHHSYYNHPYLPTFNSYAIETVLYRIPFMSRHFVYFNNDMVLGRDVSWFDYFAPIVVYRNGTVLKGVEALLKEAEAAAAERDEKEAFVKAAVERMRRAAEVEEAAAKGGGDVASGKGKGKKKKEKKKVTAEKRSNPYPWLPSPPSDHSGSGSSSAGDAEAAAGHEAAMLAAAQQEWASFAARRRSGEREGEQQPNSDATAMAADDGGDAPPHHSSDSPADTDEEESRATQKATSKKTKKKKGASTKKGAAGNKKNAKRKADGGSDANSDVENSKKSHKKGSANKGSAPPLIPPPPPNRRPRRETDAATPYLNKEERGAKEAMRKALLKANAANLHHHNHANVNDGSRRALLSYEDGEVESDDDNETEERVFTTTPPPATSASSASSPPTPRASHHHHDYDRPVVRWLPIIHVDHVSGITGFDAMTHSIRSYYNLMKNRRHSTAPSAPPPSSSSSSPSLMAGFPPLAADAAAAAAPVAVVDSDVLEASTVHDSGGFYAREGFVANYVAKQRALRTALGGGGASSSDHHRHPSSSGGGSGALVELMATLAKRHRSSGGHFISLVGAASSSSDAANSNTRSSTSRNGGAPSHSVDSNSNLCGGSNGSATLRGASRFFVPPPISSVIAAKKSASATSGGGSSSADADADASAPPSAEADDDIAFFLAYAHVPTLIDRRLLMLAMGHERMWLPIEGTRRSPMRGEGDVFATALYNHYALAHRMGLQTAIANAVMGAQMGTHSVRPIVVAREEMGRKKKKKKKNEKESSSSPAAGQQHEHAGVMTMPAAVVPPQRRIRFIVDRPTATSQPSSSSSFSSSFSSPEGANSNVSTAGDPLLPLPFFCAQWALLSSSSLRVNPFVDPLEAIGEREQQQQEEVEGQREEGLFTTTTREGTANDTISSGDNEGGDDAVSDAVAAGETELGPEEVLPAPYLVGSAYAQRCRPLSSTFLNFPPFSSSSHSYLSQQQQQQQNQQGDGPLVVGGTTAATTPILMMDSYLRERVGLYEYLMAVATGADGEDGEEGEGEGPPSAFGGRRQKEAVVDKAATTAPHEEHTLHALQRVLAVGPRLTATFKLSTRLPLWLGADDSHRSKAHHGANDDDDGSNKRSVGKHSSRTSLAAAEMPSFLLSDGDAVLSGRLPIDPSPIEGPPPPISSLVSLTSSSSSSSFYSSAKANTTSNSTLSSSSRSRPARSRSPSTIPWGFFRGLGRTDDSRGSTDHWLLDYFRSVAYGGLGAVHLRASMKYYFHMGKSRDDVLQAVEDMAPRLRKGLLFATLNDDLGASGGSSSSSSSSSSVDSSSSSAGGAPLSYSVNDNTITVNGRPYRNPWDGALGVGGGGAEDEAMANSGSEGALLYSPVGLLRSRPAMLQQQHPLGRASAGGSSTSSGSGALLSASSLAAVASVRLAYIGPSSTVLSDDEGLSVDGGFIVGQSRHHHHRSPHGGGSDAFPLDSLGNIPPAMLQSYMLAVVEPLQVASSNPAHASPIAPSLAQDSGLSYPSQYLFAEGIVAGSGSHRSTAHHHHHHHHHHASSSSSSSSSVISTIRSPTERIVRAMPAEALRSVIAAARQRCMQRLARRQGHAQHQQVGGGGGESVDAVRINHYNRPLSDGDSAVRRSGEVAGDGGEIAQRGPQGPPALPPFRTHPITIGTNGIIAIGGYAVNALLEGAPHRRGADDGGGSTSHSPSPLSILDALNAKGIDTTELADVLSGGLIASPQYAPAYARHQQRRYEGQGGQGGGRGGEGQQQQQQPPAMRGGGSDGSDGGDSNSNNNANVAQNNIINGPPVDDETLQLMAALEGPLLVVPSPRDVKAMLNLCLGRAHRTVASVLLSRRLALLAGEVLALERRILVRHYVEHRLGKKARYVQQEEERAAREAEAAEKRRRAAADADRATEGAIIAENGGQGGGDPQQFAKLLRKLKIRGGEHHYGDDDTDANPSAPSSFTATTTTTPPRRVEDDYPLYFAKPYELLMRSDLTDTDNGSGSGGNADGGGSSASSPHNTNIMMLFSQQQQPQQLQRDAYDPLLSSAAGAEELWRVYALLGRLCPRGPWERSSSNTHPTQ